MENIGNRIKQLRKEHKLSQKELADKLGIGQSSICEWEKNAYEPTATSIQELAKFFKVTSDYLLGLENIAGTPIRKETSFYFFEGTNRIEKR